jgi:hypothetical protein
MVVKVAPNGGCFTMIKRFCVARVQGCFIVTSNKFILLFFFWRKFCYAKHIHDEKEFSLLDDWGSDRRLGFAWFCDGDQYRHEF